MGPLLCEMSQRYPTDKLVEAWLVRLIPVAVQSDDSGVYSSTEGSDYVGSGGRPAYASLLEGILDSIKMGGSLAKRVLR